MAVYTPPPFTPLYWTLPSAVDIAAAPKGLDKSIQWYCGDVRNDSFVNSVINDVSPDKIIHLVGIFGDKAFSDLLEVNVRVAQTLLAAILKANLCNTKVLLIGSAAEYGTSQNNPVKEDHPTQPVTPYGLTKLFQTQVGQFFFRNHGLPVVIARPFNIDGEGVSTDLAVGIWRKMIDQAEDGSVIRVGDLQSLRDYLPVEEVVSALWLILTRGVPGEIYNVCSGRPVKMIEVLRRLIDNSGKNLHIKSNESLFMNQNAAAVYGNSAKMLNLMNS